MPAALGEADRRRRAGVGHADDDVGLDRGSRRPAARPSAAAPRATRRPPITAVGAGEVDVLEHAQRARPVADACRYRGPFSSITTISPGSSSRSVRGADQVECAGLGREHPRVVEPADHERADAVGIAEADERALAHDHGGRRRPRSGPSRRRSRRRGRRRRARRSAPRSPRCPRSSASTRRRASSSLAQRGGVREVAVVPERDRAPARVAHHRLRVLPHGRAGGRVAGVADGDVARRGRRAAARRTPG